MTKKDISFQKKREVGDVITDSFEFLKQEYKPILNLITVYVLPFLLLYGAFQVYMQMNIINKIDLNDTEKLMSNIGPFYTNIFLFSLFGLFVQSLLVGTYYSYIEVYVKKGKGNFELSEVKSLLYSNGLLALAAGFTIYITVLIGVILCIVPGIYFANTFSLTAMIYIFEKKGIANAFTRSAFLTRNAWWNTFLLNILGLVIIWLSGLLISIPTFFSGISQNIFSMNSPNQIDYPNWYWILTGVSTVVSSVLWIIPYTFLAFQYFNLHEQTKPFSPPSV
ncbi:MAG: hypothetical protein R2757_02045 [Draconibacterium sp.]